MTHVLFPESGFTTKDAAAYYRAVSKYILPHLRKRPLSFKRYPDAIDGESYWEKDAPAFTPSWVKRFRVPRRSGDIDIDYIVADNAKTLAWIAEAGGIELHPFLHVIPDVSTATQVVFDLDPGPGADITDCCAVALILRDALSAAALESFPKVSGSKGLQVYVPLSAPHAATEPFARLVADELARAHPKLVTAKMNKQYRRGKVFIDWSQNADYKTTVAVYSLRAKRDRPYVSMPLTWDEVRKPKRLDWEPDDALARLAKRGDLFAPVLKLKQRLHFTPPPAPRMARSTAESLSSRLPKPGSQSGRRLFVLKKDELWLESGGRFRRWILRPDREGGPDLIAVNAGEFKVAPEYYRGEVPAEESGAYEIIEGSYRSRRLDLWFSGEVMQGRWILEKIEKDDHHKSWRLAIERSRRS